MNIVEKINNTRYTLKKILNDEWDTSSIAELSNSEVEKMYTTQSGKLPSLSFLSPTVPLSRPYRKPT